MLEFKIPEVGENIKTGTVVKIHIKPGDHVKKDQDLLELETEKATVPIPSPCEGVIKEILVKEGQEVKIGQVVFKIAAAEDADKSSADITTAPTDARRPDGQESSRTNHAKKEGQQVKISAPSAEALSAYSAVAPTLTGKGGQVGSPTSSISKNVGADVPAAPSVRRFAREIGIDITLVPGSGPGGRISIDDVKAHAKRILAGEHSTAKTAVQLSALSAVSAQPLPDFAKWGAVDRRPMNNIRKKTAQHLSHCWQTIPHVTQFDKADITELEKLRKKVSTQERKLTITPFLLKVMASALKTFPQFNASVDMTSQEIVYKKFCHIGVAVDTDRGLLVPVVRDVDKKSILELTDELNEIAGRARSRKITLDELQGGSMTLTNLGGIGGTYFTPIVNWPEVSILGVSRASWEPSLENNGFVPRFKLPLSLSYDHRLIDGADGARFLRWMCEAIQQPFSMEPDK